MKLEDLRNEQTGSMYFYIKGNFIILYHQNLVSYIFPDILKSLKDLENPRNDFVFTNNIRCINIVTTLFMSIEAYINDILKVLCLIENKMFEEYKGLKLSGRIKAIFELGQYDENIKKSFYKCGIYQQLQEFEQLRNIIVHNGYENKIEFQKTMFSSIPINCNVIDVMQSLKITISIFEYFRYIFIDLDLMPHTFVYTGPKAYYEKIDIVYNEFICKYFEEVLKKHNLSTEFETKYNIDKLQSTKVVISNMVHAILNSGQIRQEVKFNNNNTDIWSTMVFNFTKDVEISSDCFRLPNCYRSNVK